MVAKKRAAAMLDKGAASAAVVVVVVNVSVILCLFSKKKRHQQTTASRVFTENVSQATSLSLSLSFWLNECSIMNKRRRMIKGCYCYYYLFVKKRRRTETKKSMTFCRASTYSTLSPLSFETTVCKVTAVSDSILLKERENGSGTSPPSFPTTATKRGALFHSFFYMRH